MRKWTAACLLVVVAITISACGVGPDKSREDAHDTTNVDKSAPHAVAFNNHYPNVETKCDDYGHRVYVTTAKQMVVIPDPSCSGYSDQTAQGIISVGH
jgi:hypothetical protein